MIIFRNRLIFYRECSCFTGESAVSHRAELALGPEACSRTHHSIAHRISPRVLRREATHVQRKYTHNALFSKSNR